MSVLLLNEGETTDLELAGVRWRIGPIPFGKLDELEAVRRSAFNELAAIVEDGETVTSAARQQFAAASSEVTRRLLAANRDICRWSIKGWENTPWRYSGEEEEYAGKHHRVLASNLADALVAMRVKIGEGESASRTSLATALAEKILDAHHPDAESVLGFK